MKLTLLAEAGIKNKTVGNTNVLGYIAKALPKTRVVQKLLRWAASNSSYTNPGDRHTGSVIVRELKRGQRLVGMPWKEDIDVSLDQFYTISLGKQVLVGLPENRDIVNFTASAESVVGHIIRGLAFGYDPVSVLDYYRSKSIAVDWTKYVKSLNIKLSTDYSTDGYASVARGDTASIIVEPADVQSVYDNLNHLPTLISVERWCPECNAYIHMRGKKEMNDVLDSCEHEPKHEPHKPSINRHWVGFKFDLDNYSGPITLGN